MASLTFLSPLAQQLANCLSQQEQVAVLLESIRSRVDVDASTDSFWLEKATEWGPRATQELEQQAVSLEARMDTAADLIDITDITDIPTAPTFKRLQTLDAHLYTLLHSTDLQGLFTESVKQGDVILLDLLLEDPTVSVDPAANNNDPIQWASENGHLAGVDRLLQDPRVNPAAEKNLAIRWAAKNGHLAIVDRLLQDPRVDPAAEYNWALRYASKNGHLAVVDRLLQDGRVDPAADSNYAICVASRNGHATVVDRLLQDSRVDPTAEYNWAIRWASRNGHHAVVERLMKCPGVVLQTA